MKVNQKEKKRAESFNKKCPVGTMVRYWTMAREGEGQLGQTRSEARVMSGHRAVVWVTGHPACIALTHIEPVTG